MMERIYVAGPYSHGDITANVRAALDAAHALMDRGYQPYVPHLSHFLHSHRERPYEDWMTLDFVWLRQCEAVLRLPGYSPGADRETELAQSLGLPIYHDIRLVGLEAAR